MENADLRSCLESYYSVDELKNKCFDEGIDFEQFPSDKSPFIRELILHCQRVNRFEWLVGLCSERRDSLPRQTVAEKVRDHDFLILSNCHEALYKLRNVFEDRLPMPQFQERHVAQVAEFSFQALMNPGAVKRIMGAAWTKELAETVTQVVVLDKKLAGRDIVKEVEELKNRTPDEVMKFFGEYNDKRLLIERLDGLILDLEARLE